MFCVKNRLKYNHIMLRLDPIVKQLPTKSFKKGDIILTPGEVSKQGYIPIVGVIETYSIDHHGIERRIISAKDLELVPNKWLVSPGVPVDYYYRAYTDVVCGLADRRDFPKLLMDNPEALYELLLVQDNRMQAAKYRIETLIQPRAIDKLLYMFRYIVQRVSIPTDDKNWIQTIFPLTQAEFADALGITRETVAKDLSQLEKDGVIKSKSKGIYLINKNKLKEKTTEK